MGRRNGGCHFKSLFLTRLNYVHIAYLFSDIFSDECVSASACVWISNLFGRNYARPLFYRSLENCLCAVAVAAVVALQIWLIWIENTCFGNCTFRFGESKTQTLSIHSLSIHSLSWMLVNLLHIRTKNMFSQAPYGQFISNKEHMIPPE